MGRWKTVLSRWIYAAAVAAKPIITRVIPLSRLQGAKQKVFQAGITEQSRTQALDPLLPDGVNLVGYLRAQFGLGQSARLMAEGLEASSYPYCALDLKAGAGIRHGDHQLDGKIVNQAKYNINLLHIMPGGSFQVMLMQLPEGTLSGRYNIGYWMFELENIPEDWKTSFQYVNEVWTPSEFASEAFRKHSPVPVYTMPYGITAEPDRRLSRKDFSLPEDQFLFLMMFDSGSTSERKNPRDAIRAFRMAFENHPRASLVIKVNNASQEDLDKLRRWLEGLENVYLLQGTYPKSKVYSLISLCDVFVSLHRSEGFGLPMAEAMLLKTPCIATDYSANRDFMNGRTACLVRATMVDVALENHPVYTKGNKWAQPDIEQAADYMRRLMEDQTYYKEIQTEAYRFITQIYSLEACARRIDQRIQAILSENIKK